MEWLHGLEEEVEAEADDFDARTTSRLDPALLVDWYSALPLVIRAVVFDIGERLVDETRTYGTWADWLRGGHATA